MLKAPQECERASSLGGVRPFFQNAPPSTATLPCQRSHERLCASLPAGCPGLDVLPLLCSRSRKRCRLQLGTEARSH
eukprot:3132489-Amphidinium_carterae.1